MSRFVFRGMDPAELSGENKLMISSAPNENVSFLSAVTWKPGKPAHYQWLFFTDKVGIADWYAMAPVRNGNESENRVFLVDLEKQMVIDGKKVREVSNNQIISYRSLRTEKNESKTKYKITREDGNEERSNLSLQARNNVLGSNIIAVERPQIHKENYVELSKREVELLSMIESSGVSEEDYENIVKRFYYLHKDERQLTQGELEEKKKCLVVKKGKRGLKGEWIEEESIYDNEYLENYLQKNFSDLEGTFYHAFYSKEPKTVDQLAKALHSKLGNRISEMESKIIVQSIKDRIIQTLALAEIEFQGCSWNLMRDLSTHQLKKGCIWTSDSHEKMGLSRNTVPYLSEEKNLVQIASNEDLLDYLGRRKRH